MPDDLVVSADDTVLLAQQLIGEGRPFHAHEVLEVAWKAAPQGQRDLWKGLAQIAVGLTHARRGNGRGAVTLLRRGGDAVGRYASGADGADREEVGGPGGGGPGGGGPGGGGPGGGGPGGGEVPASVDAAAVSRAATQLADRIAAGGLDSVPADDLLIRLTPPDEG